MAERKIILYEKYRVVDEEKFFESFMFKQHINIGEMWPDENAPETIEVITPHNKHDKDVEVEEKFENKDSKMSYFDPETMVELSEKGAIKPTDNAEKIN